MPLYAKFNISPLSNIRTTLMRNVILPASQLSADKIIHAHKAHHTNRSNCAIRHTFICNLRFLYRNMSASDTTAANAEAPMRYIFCSGKNIDTTRHTAARNRNMVCLRCHIVNSRRPRRYACPWLGHANRCHDQGTPP